VEEVPAVELLLCDSSVAYHFVTAVLRGCKSRFLSSVTFALGQQCPFAISWRVLCFGSNFLSIVDKMWLYRLYLRVVLKCQMFQQWNFCHFVPVVERGLTTFSDI
jgi:hypothetical protein